MLPSNRAVIVDGNGGVQRLAGWVVEVSSNGAIGSKKGNGA